MPLGRSRLATSIWSAKRNQLCRSLRPGQHHWAVIGVEHPDVLRDLARLLWAAEEAAQPTRPPTEQYPTISVDDAYAIQDRNLLRRTEAGAQVVGRKVSQRTSALVGSGTIPTRPSGRLQTA